MSAFTREQEAWIREFVTSRVKGERHSTDDHLDLSLPVAKLKPSATTGYVLWTSTTTGRAEWVAAASAAPPSGAAGGDLTGTYPNPTIANSAITNAKVAAGAAIAYSKLNLTGSIVNADVAVGAAIVYSKLSLVNSIVNADVAAGAAIAYSKLNLAGSIVNADIAVGAAIALSKLAVDPLARANHTGTQLAATISDFTTAAQAVAVGGDVSGTVGAITITPPTAGTAWSAGLLTQANADFLFSEKADFDHVHPDLLRVSSTTYADSGATTTLAGDGAQAFIVRSTGGSPNSTTIGIRSDGSGAAELDFYNSGALAGSLYVATGTHAYIDQSSSRYLWSYAGTVLSLMPTSGTVVAPTPAYDDDSTNVTTTAAMMRYVRALEYALSEKSDFDHSHKDEYPAFGQDGSVTLKTATNNPSLLIESTGASTYAVLGLKADGSGGAEIDFYNSGAVAGSLAVQAGVHSYVDATSSRYVWQYTNASNVLALMPTSGTVTAATQAAGDNSTKLATTSYADNSLANQRLADAKGDLFAGTGDNAISRVAVGSDGKVLTADSAASTGVSWQPAGTPGVHASTHDVLGTDSLAPYYTGNSSLDFLFSEKADFDHTHTEYKGGSELVGGYAETTSDFTTGTLNSGGTARSSAIVSLTIVSDGVSPIFLNFFSAGLACTTLGTNPTNASIELWDGTIGSGTRVGFGDYLFGSTFDLFGPVVVLRRLTLSAGSHTINACVINNTASNSAFTVKGGATYPAFLRATYSGPQL